MGTYAPRVDEQVLTLRVPRAVWITGLVIAGVCFLLGIALMEPWFAAGVLVGLLIASFPLLTRLDAVKLEGPLLSVRRGFRWSGPVNLRSLVALAHQPAAYRRPAVWLLIQREAGPKLRLTRRASLEADLREALTDQDDLQVLQVAAGSPSTEVPGLAEHLHRHVLASGALVEPRAREALDRRRSSR